MFIRGVYGIDFIEEMFNLVENRYEDSHKKIEGNVFNFYLC